MGCRLSVCARGIGGVEPICTAISRFLAVLATGDAHSLITSAERALTQTVSSPSPTLIYPLPDTYIGDVVLMVNPLRPLALYGAAQQQLYTPLRPRSTLPPHTYAAAAAAYHALRSTGASQCFVIR